MNSIQRITPPSEGLNNNNNMMLYLDYERRYTGGHKPRTTTVIFIVISVAPLSSFCDCTIHSLSLDPMRLFFRSNHSEESDEIGGPFNIP